MSTLPNADSLRQLPLRAIIAYTARSAGRVIGSYVLNAEHDEASACQAAVQEGIELAMRFAAGEEIDPETASRVENGVVRAVIVASEGPTANRGAAFAANAAYAAVNATTTAAGSVEAANRAAEAGKVVVAATTAADAASAINPRIKHLLLRDWQKLSRMKLGAFPSLGEGIDPSGDGPLGPLTGGDDEPAAERKGKPAAKPAAKNVHALISARQKKIEEAQNRLEKDIASYQKERERLQQERSIFESERRACRKDLEQLNEQQDAFRQETEKREKTLTELEQMLQEQKAAVEHERAHLDGLKNLEADKVVFDAERQAFDEQRREFEEQRRQLDADLARIESERKELDEGQQRLKQDRQQYAQEIARFQADRQQLTDFAAKLERMLSERPACVQSAGAPA